MKRILIVLNVLVGAINALDNNSNVVQLNEANGHVYLYDVIPVYAGSDTQYYKEAFDLDVNTSDILARIIVASENSKEADVFKREKEFKNQFSRTFRSFLPLKLFMGKEENDIVKLLFYGQVVHLKCKTSHIDKEWYKYNNPFSQLYSSLLFKFDERQNFQHKDKELLLKNNVITEKAYNDYTHGIEGYSSIINLCPTSELTKLGALLSQALISNATIVTNAISPKMLMERQFMALDKLNQSIIIAQAMQKTVEKQQSLIKHKDQFIATLVSHLPEHK